MKKNLTKTLAVSACLSTSFMTFSQPPTGSPPPVATTPASCPPILNQAWFRGGNNPVGSPNNIFGTMWNSPVYHYTAAQQRLVLNGNVTSATTVGAGAINKDGFLGINVNDPWSRVHIGGSNLAPYGGYRPWMREGLTIQNANDQMWLGVKRWGAVDQQNATINWGDDPSSGAGPDHFVFNFTSSSYSSPYPAPGVTPNAQTLEGLEVMRLTDLGKVGIGPRFSNIFVPQSTLHQHQENSAASWMQISNQASPIIGNPVTTATGPTAITANDGLRWGINPDNTAYLYNQENKPLLFSTNAAAGTTAERLRITHIGEPGTPNPGGFFPANISRVGISHNPAQPLNNPLALLHLGYNTFSFFGPPSLNGWRNWMDVGIFTSNSTDHMYVGLKPEIAAGGVSIDRQDAIIGWGDNYLPAFPGLNTGPDKLRVIFTSPAAGSTGAGPGAMSTGNGLEFVRYVPFHNTSLNVNDPRTGFGDFNSLLPAGTVDPRNTIEINSILNGPTAPANISVAGSYPASTGASGLRFKDLTKNSLVVPNSNILAVDSTKVLTVDSAGNVVLIKARGIAANSLGNICGGLANPLLTNWEIPLNSRNFIFSNATAGTTGRVGIGTIAPACTPGNLLEVNKGTTSAISGLRLTDLATAIPLAATTKVLSVDANGDVIVTTAPIGGGGASLGNLCSVAPVPLLGNYQIEMAGNNFNYTMPATSPSQVNIGLPVCATNPTRLFVTNDFYTTGAAVISNLSSASSIIGLHAQSQNTGSGNVIAVNAVALGSGLSGIGVNSESNASSTQQNIAINGNAKNGTLFSMAANLDVIGSASPLNQGINTEVIGGTNATATSFGINSTVSNIGSANYGGYFSALNATNNYGIYAQAGPLTPSGSIPPGPSYAGYFNGDVVRTGSDNFTSDAMLKQNIDTITNAMGIINLLKPKTYDYKLSIFPSMHLPSGKQYGLIAQDVQTILPELVNTNVHPAVLDSLGAVVTPSVSYLSLEYQQLTAIMIKAMQQQQVQLHKQDSLITVLTAQINSCCTNASARTSNPNINSLDVELSDKDVIVLNQNVPNPFAEQTTITYNVPASVTKAQILFFNNIGQVIQTVDIKTRGMGKVNVFASDLSAGLYNYSLVADGKVIDSKKMVRE